MSETWKYDLFISINFQQHEIYKERPAKFEVINRKSQGRVYGFHKGHHLHHNVGYDVMYYLEGSIFLLSIKTIYYLEVVLPLSSLEMISLSRKYPPDHYVARLKHYFHLVTRMTSRVNIHESRKIMHRESIFMHRVRSCIASQYSCIAENHALQVNIDASRKIMHREKISYLTEIYASREEFIHRRNLHIVRRFHISQKFMHREKISYITEIYASREDYIPRKNSCITRRFYASLKFTHRERISCLSESYVS